MLKKLYPREYVNSVNEINYERLLESGINSLIFDIDNTLVPHYEPDATEEVVELIKKLKIMGFKICLLSNNNIKRVELFNKKLMLNNISKARKPFLKGVNKAISMLESEIKSIAIIGDQVFTDILCGNRIGIYTILVKPIVEKDEFSVYLKRGLEKKIISGYLKNR